MNELLSNLREATEKKALIVFVLHTHLRSVRLRLQRVSRSFYPCILLAGLKSVRRGQIESLERMVLVRSGAVVDL